MLDYSLETPAQRNAYLYSLDLSNYNTTQLELCANYLLHAADKSLANHKEKNNSSNNKNIELDENNDFGSNGSNGEIKPRKGSNSMLRPVVPIPWEHENLKPLKQDIETLLAAEAAEPDDYRRYKIHSWIIDLRLDARCRIPDYTINVAPSWTTTEPIDIEMAGLDWTNSFHIKQLIRHYSELKQNENTKHIMEYFDDIIETTPLEPWHKHILIRYIDGLNTITIAREVAEQYDKILYPGFISKVMRSIYRQIAEQADRMDVERSYRSRPDLWRRCSKCGEKHPDHPYWWRVGQRNCKACLSTKRSEEQDEQIS